MTNTFVELPGSSRAPKATARRIGDLPQDEPIELTIELAGPAQPSADDLGLQPETPEEVRRSYAASPETADKVAKVLQEFGFKIVNVSPETRSIKVLGTVADAEAAFKPKLALFHSADQGDYRGREGPLCVPKALDGLVTGVFGIDERRVARRKSLTEPPAGAATAAAHVRPQPITPTDLEHRYNFPAGTAAGRQIVIAEFGGGYFDEDLTAYCAKVGRPKPTVVVHGFGQPAYTRQEILAMPPDQKFQELGMSSEVMMDVEIVAGLCPDAKIFVYFAPFTQMGWVDLLNAVISGAPADQPIAVSVSWGLAEDDPEGLSSAAAQAVHDKLNAIARMGITVCVSSGDDGSGDQVADGAAHVDFPASSPFTMGVGGTEFAGAGPEKVWWDAPGRRTGTKRGGGASGGGVSTVFPKPAWQTVQVASVNSGAMEGRIVPDVAALAGKPLYDLIFLGQDAPNGGTSASAPLWASLIARVSEHLPANKQRRFLTRLLYAPLPNAGLVGQTACRPVISGDNASHPSPGVGYHAGRGYSAVTGWGIPDGQALATALAQV